MGARKSTQIRAPQGTTAAPNFMKRSREQQTTREQQAYDRESQYYDRALQTAREQQAYQQVQPRTTDSYATRAQPSPPSYQQMHMQMLQDRAASKQSPMVRQDTANDQRMNEYRARQGQQEQERLMQERAAAERSKGRRRFSWQR